MVINRNRTPLRARDMTLIALFAVLIAICSWLAIPAPIPLTMQTFAVFFTLLTLGGKRGSLCIILYLLMGAVGLPVFSGFQGGLAVLLGPGGGYLLGFAFAAALFRVITARSPYTPAGNIIGCIIGHIVCYAFGTFWYISFYGDFSTLAGTLAVCVLPFVIPDIIKLTLAFLLSRRLNILLHCH